MSSPQRDPYPDALRACALLVVVFGHWIATLPRLRDGRLVDTDHLLAAWEGAALLTWLVQVVPLFVFVSAAVSAAGVARRVEAGGIAPWWATRALALARPTVTYVAVLVALALLGLASGGRLLGVFDQSLTVHLWFLLMLLTVQALLPWCLRLDERFGLAAVAALVVLAAVFDLVRAGAGSLSDLIRLGSLVAERPAGIAWLNMLVVWLLPQQLGIAWARGRIRGAGTGLALLALGAAWLVLALASGYPVAMVGVALAGNNMLPPTLALVGVMWLQVGAVLAFEPLARRMLSGSTSGRGPGRAIAVLGALGMPLYLWHKLAELPAAWLGERLGLPIDAGVPGEPGFWLGRACWIGLCLLMVAPVIAAVVRFELRRDREVPAVSRTWRIVLGGVALYAGLAAALAWGVWPGAVIALPAVLLASGQLRQRAAVAAVATQREN
ncbi:acyltransferase family protein [Luteimonas kalidii]|uniref:Acyltransferase family protein n=1 Tax=Luteimonas kalidii TaxID=3042025 RepID=A0ABT6JSL5_9GAMM|nr:acyltransferase family protein [Luteimonas kalidii]MDH5833487.1 acyltransferase family protein [Luteimonas kalidii]